MLCFKDDYVEALQRLFLTIDRAYRVNPGISFEVFIHKVDGLSDDHKIGILLYRMRVFVVTSRLETQRDIHSRLMDELADAGYHAIHLSFHLTSIYDHSIFEAFSKVIQKLIPQLPALENLLNMLCSNSGIEKAFVFDVVSKIYVATDSSPVDMQSYELCSDMIDVVIDLSVIYNDEQQEWVKEPYAMIRLNNGMILYMYRMNRELALVCLLREDSLRLGLLDFNLGVVSSGILECL
jgi:Ras-related GTP-binding protein C/D